MKKHVESWSVQQLRETFPRIEFPEYQREPNLWSLTEKQRLIDSMLRQFDISSLYLYQHTEGSLDCVDGRQRIGAIMAFLGDDSIDSNPNFPLKHLNEIYEDSPLYPELVDKSFDDITCMSEGPNHDPQCKTAQAFVKAFLNYELTVILLSDSNQGEEFNLQFTRLNLGTIVNSGEKLHAMVGDIRNVCFDKLGKHEFLKGTDIPTRRFAREQVAAQIMSQAFSLNAKLGYSRTRHVDLQRFFKEYNDMSDEQYALVDRVEGIFDLLEPAFRPLNILRNRAITVSTVLLALEQEVSNEQQAQELARFLNEFSIRLRWQVPKGFDMDHEYRHLREFQRNITQASAEGSSARARAELLTEQLETWRSTGLLRGDAGWKERTGLDPHEKSLSIE